MNDNPPKFEQSSYSCGISVNAKRDQFVTVVKASDPDVVDQNHLRYTIVGGNEQQTFSMDPSTGIITLTNLAYFGEERIMVLNVSVSDSVYTSFTRLKIELLPANLHSPVFEDVIVDVQVLENQVSGYPVITVKATDKDFGEFGTITYSIHSDLLSETFSIDKTSGKIVTKTPLDREKQKLYEIPVMATDGGGRSSFLVVRVKVADLNDNAPTFLLKEYKTSIFFNQSTTSAFMKVRAVDVDEGAAADITYSIYDRKSSGITDIFGVNQKTGDLFLLHNADAWGKNGFSIKLEYVPNIFMSLLEGQVFQFFIRATDGGIPEKHSDVPVNILIMGPKDVPPFFERNSEKFFLSENSPAGTMITRLKIVSNVSATYQIVSEDNNSQFVIDGQGQLTLGRPLDFESKVSHVIGILASTDSSPPLTTLVEVMLQVLDENDHPPHFESSPYVLNLAENVDEGTSILKGK